jgi:hypothetical protein
MLPALLENWYRTLIESKLKVREKKLKRRAVSQGQQLITKLPKSEAQHSHPFAARFSK